MSQGYNLGVRVLHATSVYTNHRCYPAITIEAEVMHAVNTAGTGGHPLPGVSGPRQSDSRFVSSLAPGLASHSVLPPQSPTELHKTNVTLTIFTAEVDVDVDKKLYAELLRSTKKKPPTQLKYHLIYVGVCRCLGFLRADRVSFEDWEGRVRSKFS